jgi:hypothetical protein
MQKRFTGVPKFDLGHRFQSENRSRRRYSSADLASDGELPTAPPSASPAAASGSSASQGDSFDLSKLFQNLQKLNIASESTRPEMPTLAEALRKHFGDQAKIEVDGQAIKITTQQGVRRLEVYTRGSNGGTRAYLRLRVDERTTRPIGQLLRYGDEYYIDPKSLERIDGKKPKKGLPKSFLYGTGALAAGGAVVGLSRFLGGGDDDDDKKKAQSDSSGGIEEMVQLNPENNEPTATAFAPTTTTPALTATASEPTVTSGGQVIQKADSPRVTVAKRPKAPNVVVNVPEPQVIREITSGEAPVQTRRKGNETVVKAETSSGVFTLNIGADKTLILKDKEVVGEFPTSEIIRAVGQITDGKTEREVKRSGQFEDLLKNPWFFVAIALALTAFTRRNKRE